MFEAGFKEFARLRKKEGIPPEMVLEGSQRSMRIALSRELEALEANLPMLATVGSVSPYIGLFGTVWGIMNSFGACRIRTRRRSRWSLRAFQRH